MAAIRGFLAHVFIFAAAMVLLYAGRPGGPVIPLAVGWLIGLSLHGLSAIMPIRLLGGSGGERRSARPSRKG